MFSDKDNQVKSTHRPGGWDYSRAELWGHTYQLTVNAEGVRTASLRDGDLKERVKRAGERRQQEVGVRRGRKAGVKIQVQVEKQIAQSEGQEELQPKEVQEQEQGKEVLKVKESVKIPV